MCRRTGGVVTCVEIIFFGLFLTLTENDGAIANINADGTFTHGEAVDLDDDDDYSINSTM